MATVPRRDGREYGVGRVSRGVLDAHSGRSESRPADFPLSSFVYEHATGLIVHSRTVSDLVRASGFTGALSVIPHPAWPMRSVEPARIAPGPVIGCFGVVNASKRIPELLQATARVRAERPDVTLLLVGPTSPGFDLERRLQRIGFAGEGLVREGWADERRLWALMAGVDIAVNLRHPTMGETSGSVIRAMSLGKPLVVTDVGWFSELPGDVALKVPPGASEVEVLSGALELLVSRPDLRDAMGAAAAGAARREHDLGRVAEALRRRSSGLRGARRSPASLGRSAAAADVGISGDPAGAGRSPALAEVGPGERSAESRPGSAHRHHRLSDCFAPFSVAG